MTAEQIDKGLSLTPSFDLQSNEFQEVKSVIRESWGEAVDEENVLKRARQRLVVRVFINGSSMILKKFPLDKITSRIRHRKFAYREFFNYQEARKRGVPTPKCFGLIEQRTFGLVSCSGILMEDISDSTDALILSESMPYEDAAEKCLPALAFLYQKGVNHIDAREENILFSDSDWVIIDWQYATFVTPRAEWLLEHLAAYFIKKAPDSAQQKLKEEWLKKLHECAGHHLDLALFNERVLQLLSKHRGKNARKKLMPT